MAACAWTPRPPELAASSPSWKETIMGGFREEAMFEAEEMEGWEQCQGRCTPAVQGQKSLMPIKRDPGDRFTLGLELMLSVNSHMPCKCDEQHLRLHSISGSAISGPLGGTGVSSLEGRALAEGAPGTLHTPPHSLLHTQMLICAAEVKMEGEHPLARTRLPHRGSALLRVAQPMMSPGQFGTIAGTVCRDPSQARSTPDAGVRTCSRSQRGHMAEFEFIQECL
uniref:Uncharacterized protein n=1 Tax=Rangifer tarandus platyrhynchus TaxID=3082113 RepID=A0ACB0E833_RANTA|nr:unnamed protein product [Rangifer tarandus platyrhynchus]